MVWKVGNLDRPADITTHAALQSVSDDLAQYLVNLGKADSKEFKEAQEINGDSLKWPVEYGNISASQLCSLFLRRIALSLEDGESMSWDTLQFKFREQCIVPYSPNYELQVHLLYQFTNWLKDNNIKFRQGKNIG